MSARILVQIIAAPIACKEGLKDTWREVAVWAGGQLSTQFGEQVLVQYYDLFDPTCPPVPPGMQLPVVMVNVMVNDEVLNNGGRISVPLLRRKIDAILKERS